MLLGKKKNHQSFIKMSVDLSTQNGIRTNLSES